MTLHTSILGCSEVKQQVFRNGLAGLRAINQCIVNKILEVTRLPPNIIKCQAHVDPRASSWGKDNARPLNASETNKVFHSDPAILQGGGQVKLVLKGIRILLIDPKGFKGLKLLQFHGYQTLLLESRQLENTWTKMLNWLCG
jgi:hypothetical protein